MRDQLFDTLSHDILKSDIPLTGTPILDYESLGLHCYDPQKMKPEKGDYSPPHMDAGTLTILVRDDRDFDGLEVADLESTEELGSEGIGRHGSFLRVPAAPNEVVVFAGTRLQRLFGKTKVRACVHRVRGPAQASKRQSAEERLSVAIFCAPPSG